jgi:hypothetical protein
MLRSILAISCFLPATAGVANADGPYDDLLKYASPSANTIALIDVKAAFASPLSKTENWAEKGQANNRGGLGFLPPDAEKVAITSDINLNTLKRDFQVGLVKLRNVPPMGELAAREGGTYDEIADRGTVVSPRDVYFIAMSASEMAAVYPADRQYTARWIRAAKAAKTTPLTGYLKTASEKAGENTVTIAMDLGDAVDKALLRFSLPASPSVAKNKNVDISRLANFLASVKGMTFKANINQTITASMTWEFGFDPAEFKKTLPNLILELIDGQGISIPDLDTWEATFTETSITLKGSMRTPDLKHVVSLFAFPTANEDLNEKPMKDSQVSAGATRRYFTTVVSIVDDIKKSRDNPNYRKTATWHEKAAAQIEHLSRQRVDPVAVTAALQLASRLKSVAESLRGVPIDVNALENQQYYFSGRQYGVGVGGWWGFRPGLMIGPVQVDTNIPQIQAAINKVIDDDHMHRTEVWSQISRIIVDTKTALSEKLKITFQ